MHQLVTCHGSSLFGRVSEEASLVRWMDAEVAEIQPSVMITTLAGLLSTALDERVCDTMLRCMSVVSEQRP